MVNNIAKPKSRVLNFAFFPPVQKIVLENNCSLRYFYNFLENTTIALVKLGIANDMLLNAFEPTAWDTKLIINYNVIPAHSLSKA